VLFNIFPVLVLKNSLCNDQRGGLWKVNERLRSLPFWNVLFCTETTAILRDQANLWPGNYKVKMEIMDQQGKSCTETQVLDVLVCTCEKETKFCAFRETSTAKFGALGVLLFLLGLLLLLCESIGCCDCRPT